MVDYGCKGEWFNDAGCGGFAAVKMIGGGGWLHGSGSRWVIGWCGYMRLAEEI
ncbi:hypothetical protein HanHA300_Chr15g0558801 [Helianthus annuus]|nr:hypothetical protein HanHA300_Chr15g0558801 [Helianthus annuus]KAJ0472513.1 hypothetical protein HanHA89_Chr15g0607881 [Helianthus annuus]KAJ0648113.1 hypothetical protein HanLR1_Chr15g0569231 [Helianthus annuus]